MALRILGQLPTLKKTKLVKNTKEMLTKTNVKKDSNGT